MVDLNRLEEYFHSKHTWAVPTSARDKHFAEAAPIGSNSIIVVLKESISSSVKTLHHVLPHHSW